MQRLAGEEHHVVGDVDDVVDRPLPRGREPRLEPERRRSDLDVGECPRREPRAEFGYLDRDRGEVGDVPFAGRLGVLGPGRRRQIGTGDGMDLPADAVDAEAVGAVGGDLEVEDRLGDRQHLGERRAGCPGALEDCDPVRILADLHLDLRQDHPRGLDAAQLRLAELRPVTEHRTRQGDRDGLPRRHVGSPADDRSRLALAGVDSADPEAVRVRMRLGGEHLADHEALTRRRSDRRDPLDLGAGHRQALAELARAETRVAVRLQP